MLKILIERDGTPDAPGTMTSIDIETRRDGLSVTASKSGKPAETWRRVRIPRDPKRGLYPTVAEALGALVYPGAQAVPLPEWQRRVEQLERELRAARARVSELQEMLKYEEAA